MCLVYLRVCFMYSMSKKYLLIVCAILISCIGFFVYAFDIPVYDAWVTDTANILSQDEEVFLESALTRLEEMHRAEIAILTTNDLQGYDIAEYAYTVATERWIGKEVDNGVLVVVAPEDREWRIEVWYGLEWDIPDITAYHVWRDTLVPAFREQKYAEWLKAMIAQLSGYVAGTYTDEDIVQQWNTQEWTESFVMWLVVLSFLAFFVSWGVRQRLDDEKRFSKSKKQQMALWGSLANMLPGFLILWPWALVYSIPLYLIWVFVLTNPHVHIGNGMHGFWSSGWWWSWGSSFGGWFSGFGGGSFGGWGASGGR